MSGAPAKPTFDYLRRQRHMLIDMHVPDFEPGFLKNLDPAALADLYVKAGADTAMFYCNSMTGLALWPTNVGRPHPNLAGRDIVAESVAELHDRGLAACAYYSVNFNNEAYNERSDWRIVNANPAGPWGENSRSGICCPSSREFHAYAVTQVEELTQGYDVDALFLDMMFWPDICLCPSCGARLAEEEGIELPETIDFFSPDFARFLAARERWLADELRTIKAAARKHRDIPVFANCSMMTASWVAGFSQDFIAECDVIGGDVLLGLPLFAPGAAAASPDVFQYMHTATGYTTAAAQTTTVDELLAEAMVATAFGGQFMAIDAVRPDGTVQAETFDVYAEVFEQMRPYEAYLGGSPLADVAVYWSLQAQVDFDVNGKAVADAPLFMSPTPHGRSALGAVEALRRAHLPFGVITRAELSRLDRYPVIVLPNVLRMDDEEVAAFRAYVERGGRLYASGYTSLVSTDGTKHDDFLLADVFGCHFEDKEPGASYIRPVTPEAAAAIAPGELVGHGTGNVLKRAMWALTLRVTADEDATTVATHTRRYGDGRPTKTSGWAAIFSDPPYEDTDRPVIVRHRYGAGEVVYSACDIESTIPLIRGSERLFVHLVRTLLDRPGGVEADTHPDVWVVAFDEPEEGRRRISLLHRRHDEPPLPVPPFTLRVAPPDGAAFTALRRLPGGEEIPFTVEEDGRLAATVEDLHVFQMLSAEYE